MNRSNTLSRLDRLDWLASRLKSNEPVILREVAAELGVSQRSISRDINVLRERGLPIESDRGRGGGVRLSPNWGIGRVHLTHKEVVNVLVSLAMTEQMENSLLLSNLNPIKNKLIASFSRENQFIIKGLRHRIRIGSASSIDVLSGFKATSRKKSDVVLESFLLMQKAAVSYRDGSNKITSRIIEPHYIVLNYPIWYALCWDELRADVRTFRIDRITKIKLLGDKFSLRPYDEFTDSMQGNEVIVP